MKHFLILIILLSSVFGQLAGSWRTYADAHYTNAIASFGDEVFVGTKGGLIRYNPALERSTVMTNLDGLGGLDITGLAVLGDKLFYCASNGSIGRLEGNRFRTNSDLVRSNISANDLIASGENLFVATSVGISKLNIFSGTDPIEIAENYTKLGSFDRNIAVTAISADDSLIWAATASGLAFARLSDNLFVPGGWRNMSTSRPVNGVFADSGGVWFALEPISGQPSIFWTDGTIVDTLTDSYMFNRIIDDFFYFNNEFYAAGGSGLFKHRPNGTFAPVRLSEHWAVHGGTSHDGELFVGMEVGFGVLREDTVRVISPNTPSGTGFSDVAFAPDGAVWLIARNLGVMRLENDRWEAFSDWTISTSDSLMAIVERGIFTAYSIDIDATGALWVGTNGYGVFRRASDGEWQVFNETNSVLRGITGAPSVVVCRALAYDPFRDLIWVTNFYATSALAVAAFSPYGGLDSPVVSYYSGSTGITSNNIHGIAVDESRVWLVIKDEGVVEIALGSNIAETSDDRIYAYRDALPSSSVFQIASDSEGRAWIAADGGVATIEPSLGIVLQRTIPDHISLGVADVAIDEWDNVWIATDDGAAMFRSSDTTWHAIKSRLSTNADSHEMTDLPVDYLYSVKVNPANGEVWFMGEGAIGVLTTGFGSEGDKLSDLISAPNPFIWDGWATTSVIISGVPADADLNIFSADGGLVRTITSAEKGPTAAVEWDGRNTAGKPVASGVYILIAPSSRGIARGKIALIRNDL